MKRRVLIAKAALGTSPRVLFLDEPDGRVSTSACKEHVVRSSSGLRARGVDDHPQTHYIEEAEEIADRDRGINTARYCSSKKECADGRNSDASSCRSIWAQPLERVPFSCLLQLLLEATAERLDL